MKNLCVLMVFLLVGLSLTAQAKELPAAVKCDQCGMDISDEAYESQLKVGEKILFFDNLGCMLKFEKEHKIDSLDNAFVKTLDQKKWISLNKASVVLYKGKKTPMNYGLHTFEDFTQAEVFVRANKNARIISLNEINLDKESDLAEGQTEENVLTEHPENGFDFKTVDTDGAADDCCKPKADTQ